MTAAYLRSCPNCGQQLSPVVLGPDSAPWVCPACRLAWWVTELEQRTAWVPAVRCFAYDGLAGRQAKVDGERVAAAARGTSVRPEQLPLLSAGQLSQLARVVPAGTPFAAQVAAAVKAAG